MSIAGDDATANGGRSGLLLCVSKASLLPPHHHLDHGVLGPGIDCRDMEVEALSLIAGFQADRHRVGGARRIREVADEWRGLAAIPNIERRDGEAAASRGHDVSAWWQSADSILPAIVGRCRRQIPKPAIQGLPRRHRDHDARNRFAALVGDPARDGRRTRQPDLRGTRRCDLAAHVPRLRHDEGRIGRCDDAEGTFNIRPRRDRRAPDKHADVRERLPISVRDDSATYASRRI
jgi:hypothetical protein